MAAEQFICIERVAALGDVLMALGAAKAVKAAFGCSVIMITAPFLRKLVECCPHIDYVADDLPSAIQLYGDVKHVQLGKISFGLSSKHQIDAFLEAFGIAAEASKKSIDLTLDQAAEDEAERLVASWPSRLSDRARILIHPAQSDPNRTWPMERWTELVSRLIALGHQVVVIGSARVVGGHGVHSLAVDGLLSAVDSLSIPGTIALMGRSDTLISTDSGPIQMAGATDIGIVGLYSTVAGAWRLPFRHGVAAWRAEAVKPSCAFHPCYPIIQEPNSCAPLMHDPELLALYNEKVEKVWNKSLSAATMLSEWCPDRGSVACMKQQIMVPMVMDAIGHLDPRIVSK